MGKETIKTKGCKLQLDVVQFIGIRRCNIIPSNIILSNQGNIYRQSRSEKEKLTL
jgi:hypothetical protein